MYSCRLRSSWDENQQLQLWDNGSLSARHSSGEGRDFALSILRSYSWVMEKENLLKHHLWWWSRSSIFKLKLSGVPCWDAGLIFCDRMRRCSREILESCGASFPTNQAEPVETTSTYNGWRPWGRLRTRWREYLSQFTRDYLD